MANRPMYFKVKGRYRGKSFKKRVRAFSPAQAKLIAAFDLGLGGANVRDFVRSPFVRAKKV